MKKYLFRLSAIMMVFVVSFSLTSCSSDSVDDNLEEILKANVWRADANYDLMEWGDNLSFSKENVSLFFLGNGSGIGKSYTKEIDTYFGESSTTVPFAFSYSVSGSSVRINNNTYSYKNGSLVTQDGRVAFTRASYTQSDRNWLETVRFYAMSDSERLNVNLIHGCNVDAQISDTKYSITLFLKIPASAQAHSRYITSIEAQYSIKDGTFTSSEAPENVLVEDKDYTASTVAFVNTTSQATITASFYYFDSKNKKKMYAGSATYSVPGDDDDDGNDDGNNNGDDDGDDEDWSNEHYNKFDYSPTGTIQGHDYVDLGLPSGTLWATCNVGADNPEDYGDYYAWGETVGYKGGKSTFSWSTYKYCNGSHRDLKKYCTKSAFGTYDGISKLVSSDDVAQVNWGNKWQMPSKTQLDELRTKCSWIKTRKNGVNGFLVINNNTQKGIFLPAAGSRNETLLYHGGSCVFLWTCTLDSSFPCDAYELAALGSGSINTWGMRRKWGNSIRPVCKK